MLSMKMLEENMLKKEWLLEKIREKSRSNNRYATMILEWNDKGFLPTLWIGT